MKEIILIKLGEIVLKGLNRNTFEAVLLKNIKRRLAPVSYTHLDVYKRQERIRPAFFIKPFRAGEKTGSAAYRGLKPPDFCRPPARFHTAGRLCA